jgi:pyruvate dehydrogenase E1 component alpha subunit
MSLPNKKAFRIDDLAQRAKAYGIPGKSIDGNDVIEVFETVRWAKKHVKKNGPVLLISNTYRFKGHAKADANRYRTKEEVLQWQKLDPIPRLKNRLIEEGLASEEDLDQVVREVQRDVEEAESFALNGSEPSIQTLLEDVYA